jgi:hypothetical protein
MSGVDMTRKIEIGTDEAAGSSIASWAAGHFRSIARP